VHNITDHSLTQPARSARFSGTMSLAPLSPRRSPRPPFDRQQWLERMQERRTREKSQLYTPTLQKISPVLLQKQLRGDLSKNDYFAAITAINVGGDEYATWSHEMRPQLLKVPVYNWGTPRPATVGAQTRGGQLPPLSNSVMENPTAALFVAMQPSAAASKKASVAASTQPSPATGHVDHALEMWRNGKSAGGLYQFVGVVDTIGAGDNKPVTDKELEEAHDLIRSKLTDKFGNLRKAFRNLDENFNNKVDRTEALRVLMNFNLTGVREKTLSKIFDIFDKDGDGIEFDEFSTFMMQEDALKK